MNSTVATARPSDPVRNLDTIRPTQARAVLRSDHIGLALGVVIKDAVVKHYGSVKAAAISLNNVDPSLMMRELEAGKIGRLEQADDAAKAAIAAALFDAYGQLEDPKARARRALREVEARIREVDAYLEYAAS